MKYAGSIVDPELTASSCSTLDFPSPHPREMAAPVALHATKIAQVAAGKAGLRKPRPSIAVILVDQSKLVRAGLRHILSGTRFLITADCCDLQDVPSAAYNAGAAIAVIGPVRDMEPVLARIRTLKNEYPDFRVIMLWDEIKPDELAAAIRSGIDSYLLRNEIEPKTLLKSLDMVLADGIVVSPGIAKLMGMNGRRDDAGPPAPAPAPQSCAETPASGLPSALSPASDIAVLPHHGLTRLSERERLILTHLTEGASNKQIARALDVAEATVKAHVKSLLRKLRVSNRTQAAMWAMNCATPTERVRAAE